MNAHVPTELLQRYDQPGPRYTSYPTAPVWNERFGPGDHADRLRAAGERQGEPLSLYAHLPFCESMCFYCACNVVITQDHQKGERYVDDLLKEADLAAAAMRTPRPVLQHHWGGGTPTFLAPATMQRLFRGLCERFPLADDAEVSVEVDPRVTTKAHLEALREVGFNRISMGVQDFDPRTQEAIHRIQSFELTKELVDTARALGFGSINLDLVYGLPHQSVDSFDRTLDKVLELRPERLACYSYAHVPWLKKHQTVIDEATLPRGVDKLRLLQRAMERLGDDGYEAIGMDHFARGDDELARAADDGRLHRNFMGYTTRAADDMVSFGMTAISEVAGAFAQNHKTVAEWRTAIEQGLLPTHRGHLRSDDDERRRAIILDLMCRFRCRFDEHGGREDFERRYGAALAGIEPLQRDGLVELDDDGIHVTPTGRLLVRNVCMLFDAYLGPKAPEAPRFSRTV